VVPGGLHLAVPDLVAGADRHRGAVLIVQARLVTLGRQYEEAAADLGASRWQTMRRVMLPLLGPAIFASAVLVFSGVIDDSVIVRRRLLDRYRHGRYR
jgi:ABC-type maltose transport system permease subunit